MIEQCNFKEHRTKDAEPINGCFILEHICTIAQFNAKCVLEENCVLYQAYRNSVINQLPHAGGTVVRCPVCDGRGTVPTGVDQTTQCRSCMGRGIVVGQS